MSLFRRLRARMFGEEPDSAEHQDQEMMASSVDREARGEPPDGQSMDTVEAEPLPQGEEPTEASLDAETVETAVERSADSGESAVASADVEPQSPDSVDDVPADLETGPAESGSVPTFQDAVPGRQERAAGRILDDEGLRGDLTDDEYQPLLDWALSATDALAAGTAHLDDEQADTAIDDGLEVIRDTVRAASDAIVAHNEGRADDCRWALDTVSQTWKPSLVGGDDAAAPETLWQPLQRLADQLDDAPDMSGSDLAAAIAGALRGSVGGAQGDDSEGSA